MVHEISFHMRRRIFKTTYEKALETIKRYEAEQLPPAERECTKCRETKPIASFYKLKRGSDGINPVCSKCTVAYDLEWRKKNPDKYKAQVVRYEKSEKGKNNGRKQKRKHIDQITDHYIVHFVLGLSGTEAIAAKADRDNLNMIRERIRQKRLARLTNVR